MVFHNMKEISQQYLGCLVKNVVIIIRAYYNDSQSQTTKIEGNIAGLDVLQILNEPTIVAVPGASSRRIPLPFHLDRSILHAPQIPFLGSFACGG